jgi:cytochrome c oxidase subunit 2
MSTVDDRPMTDGDGPEEPTNRPVEPSRFREWISRPYARRIVLMSAILTLAILPIAWLVLYLMNLTGAPASPIMGEIERTMFVFTIVSSPLMAITVSILLYSYFGWGRVHGEEPPMQDSPKILTNRTGVTLWIAATSVLAMFLVVWGMSELATITAYSYGSTPANAQPNAEKPLVVNVTGQQWVWTFDYPDDQHVSSSELVVPINRPIYFNVTSKDVIHDFWVVELGIKIDANPGAVTNTGVTPTKLGTYAIRCAELCGLHHAYMETVIRVVTPDQYESWLREMGGRRTA